MGGVEGAVLRVQEAGERLSETVHSEDNNLGNVMVVQATDGDMRLKTVKRAVKEERETTAGCMTDERETSAARIL